MAKLAQNFAKYVIRAKMQSTGIVEKPDVIGAVFGQTEGLIGQDLDLRELQRTGRVGRIEVAVRNIKGKSMAEITIPSSLDASETALIAAALETIEKVGPADAKIEISTVEDVRTQKRRYVVDRARDILRALIEQGGPDSQRLSEIVREAVRTFEVSNYQGLSCGPGLLDSDEIIVVEGRADVINLLKNGIRNCIAIEGSKIPDAIVELTKKKMTTALLDGDRGGDLILKKLFEVNADLDAVARAPEGKEVEDLTKKEIFKSLREKIAADQIPQTGLAQDYRPGETRERPSYKRPDSNQKEDDLDEETKNSMLALLEDLTGTRAVYILDNENNVLAKAPISQLTSILENYSSASTIIVDSKINQAMIDMALQRKILNLVGTGFSEDVKKPQRMNVLVLQDLK